MSNSSKRSSDHLSPTINDVQKRYMWDSEQLITSNRYYIPSNLEQPDNETPSTSEIQKKLHIPPIYLHDVKNHKEIISDLNNLAENKDFITKFSNSYLKINLTSEDDYRKMTKFYTDNKIPYHTYQNPKDRPVSVIFRNVPISLTQEEIMEDIEKYNLPILRITRLTNRTKQPMPLCAVDLANNEKTSEVYKIKEICKAIITVEPRRGNHSNAPQCHNCQRIGHTKNYCQLPPRCVKCTTNHFYKECDKNVSAPPTCVNCGEHHPANYKGCSYIQKTAAKRNTNGPRSRENQQSQYQPSPTIPNSQYPSYSQVLQNNLNLNNTQNNQNQNDMTSPWLDQLLKFIKNLITPFIEQIKNYLASLFQPIINIP